MPDEYKFFTADVFTDRMFGGNQLAVFTDARGLDTATMQQIAGEMNLSESVFVFPPQTATGTRRVRIFTPGKELPFAGHPTVGTAFVLASAGEIELTGQTTRITLEEGVGPVEVVIRGDDSGPTFAQLSVAKLPEEGPSAPSREALAAVLSLDVDQIGEGCGRARAFSCGVPYLFVTVRDVEALGALRLNREQWEEHVAGGWATEIYVLTQLPGGEVRARMFAPGLSIVEDPATGSAAAALAGYLTPERPDDGVLQWVVRQGVEMGRPSTMEVEADAVNGAIVAVRVGGGAVMVSNGTLRLTAV